MSELPLRCETVDGIRLLTLNRPQRRNALSPELICRLADAIVAANADAEVRVLVLTGSGHQAFCSGGDLETAIPLMTGARDAQDDWDRRLLADPLVMQASSLRGFPLHKPVVAAVNGHCMAAGMELLLGTDLRIASCDARFGLPEVRRGIIPFAGSLVRLPAQVGHANAMMLMLTGEPIDAAEALRIGLVNEVVAAQDVLPRAMQRARQIAANAPLAVQAVKRVAVEACGLPQAQGFRLEDEAKALLMVTEDAREGPRAFLEGRAPVFRGR
ncbi:MAG: enoyl-CoA hydratase-related protein [Piscinibacter sp.]